MNDIFIKLPTSKLLAIAAYGEARGEGVEGMLAVLNVIRNRTKNISKYGDSKIYNYTRDKYKAVILKGKQFSVFNKGTKERNDMISIAQDFNNQLIQNTELVQAYELSKKLLKGEIVDNTYGATYYHTTDILPSWSKSLFKAGRIGRHIFYSTAGKIPSVKIDVLQNPLVICGIGGILTLLYVTMFSEKKLQKAK